MRLIVATLFFSVNGAFGQLPLVLPLNSLLGLADDVGKELPLEGLVYPKLTRENHRQLNDKVESLNLEIRKSPNNPELFVRRALVKREAGLFDAAMQDIEKAKELKTSNKEINFYRSQLWMQKGYRGYALSTIDKYIEQFPDSAKGYFQRGLVLTYNPATRFHDLKKRSADSILEYDKVLEKDSDHQLAHLFRGYAHQCVENYDLAIADYKSLTEHDETNAIAYFFLARVYELKKDRVNACENFKKAKDAGRDLPDRFIKRNCGE